MKSEKFRILCFAVFLILVSIGLSYSFYSVATTRILSGLESASMQIFTLFAGLLGSYLIGKIFAIDAAKENIKPLARSSFRRVMSIFQSLSRGAMIIESNNSTGTDPKLTLIAIKTMVHELIATADDAVEDWSDIIPDDIEELKERYN